MSQRLDILAALQQGRSLTPLDALREFGCLTCSQRVTELRKKGWPIRSKLVEVSEGKRVARYWLEPELRTANKAVEVSR